MEAPTHTSGQGVNQAFTMCLWGVWNPKGSMVWMGPTRVLESRSLWKRTSPPHLHCSGRQQEGPIKSQKNRPGPNLLPDQGETKQEEQDGRPEGGVQQSTGRLRNCSAICNVTLTPTPIFLDLNCSLNQTHNKISNTNTSFCCLFFPLSAILFQKGKVVQFPVKSNPEKATYTVKAVRGEIAEKKPVCVGVTERNVTSTLGC